MATRTDNDVTLKHDDADQIARYLSDYANDNRAHARRTKNKAVRWSCESTANKASALANKIVSELCTWRA